MPEWITLRTPQEGRRVATSRAPFDPVTTDALVREAPVGISGSSAQP